MKKSLLIISLGLFGASAFAQTQFDCVADTWVRENNPGWSSGATDTSVEINVMEDGSNFAAMYGFNFSVPSGKKVDSATLHLVTSRYKGGQVQLFGYGNSFAENTKWENEASYIENAIAGTAIAAFNPKGQWNKDMGDKDVEEASQNLEAWENDIDVTNYVKSIPVTASRINFLIYPGEGCKQNKFFTKDNTAPVNAFKNENDTYVTTYTPAEVAPVLYVTFVDDSDSAVTTLPSAADTYVRSDAQNQRYDDKTDMEIKKVDGGAQFFGLLKFNLPYELLSGNYTVQGATLRLVTAQCKGDRAINLYAIDEDFTDDVKYETIGTTIEGIVANSEPVASFSANGQNGQSLIDYTKDSFNKEQYGNVEAWTNTIDLTKHVAAKATGTRAADGMVTLVIAKANTHNDAMKFATKEATSIGSTSEGAYYDAKDLVPQLTVAYTKGDSTEVETIVIGAADNAPVEYYDLAGRRVVNPDKGVYIMRQGDKAVKVIR